MTSSPPKGLHSWSLSEREKSVFKTVWVSLQESGIQATTAKSMEEKKMLFMQYSRGVYLLLDQTFQRALWESPALEENHSKHFSYIISQCFTLKCMNIDIISIVLHGNKLFNLKKKVYNQYIKETTNVKVKDKSSSSFRSCILEKERFKRGLKLTFRGIWLNWFKYCRGSRGRRSIQRGRRL